MAFVHGFGEGKGDAGPHPDHRGLLDPKLFGDGIGGLEADAADVARQAVRVLGHHLDGVVAVGLVDPHRPSGADAVLMQEHHDLTNHLLLGPGIGDAPGPHRSDAGHLPQAFGFSLDRLEHAFAERPDQLLGINRADAADHAGAEIPLDALDRCRRRGPEKARLELLAVGAVVDPLARGGDPLARRNGRGVTDDRYQVAMSARLGPQNAEAVVGVLEGDPLDEAGKNLLGHFCLRTHVAEPSLSHKRRTIKQAAVPCRTARANEPDESLCVIRH